MRLFSQILLSKLMYQSTVFPLAMTQQSTLFVYENFSLRMLNVGYKHTKSSVKNLISA